MSTVYIIGNGFDLNLGLKTSYRDFVTSDVFKDRIGQNNDLINYLERVNNESNWIDIEKELVTYSKTYASTNLYRDYTELCQLLIKYIKNIDSLELNKDSIAYKLFESTSPYEEISVINFNYTQTIERIFNSDLYSDHSSKNVIQIHGSVKSDKIIFGINDHARYNKDHSFLLKSSSDQFKGRECRQALEQAQKLYIFGHSLGESDHIYLIDFFENACKYGHENKEIFIYYYGEPERQKIIKQIQEITVNRLSVLRTNAVLKTINVLKE